MADHVISLPRQPSLLRLLSLAVLLVYSALVIAAALDAARAGMHVPLDDYGIQGWFRGSQRVLLPGQCATLSWQVENATSLQLSGQPVEARGSLEVCPQRPFFRELRAFDPEENIVKATVFIGLFPYGETLVANVVGALLVFVGLTVFVGTLGDLPWISRPLWRLRAALLECARLAIAETKLILHHIVTLREIRYVLFAAFTCAVGLLGLRTAPWAHNTVVAAAAAGLGLAGCIIWVRAAHTRHKVIGQTPSIDRWMLLYIGSVVIITAVFAFCLPMRAHFWMGGDEARVLRDYSLGWAAIPLYDLLYARPLTPLGILIGGFFLAPTGVDGFLIWAAIAREASALLLVGIVRLLLPRSWMIPFAAGLLFIVNPSEPTRFAAIHMQGYHLLLLLILLATFLFLLSYRRASRSLLVASMVALGAACLIVEVAFLMALIMPLILLMWRGDRARTAVWIFTWFITLSLCAVRLLLRSGEVDYQSIVLQGIAPSQIASNILIQITPLFSFFRLADAALWQWLIAIALGILSTVALLLVARRSQPVGKGTLVLMLIICLGYICLTVSMFLPLTGILAQIRTQFAPSPGQALFWALVLTLFAVRFTPRQANLVVALAVGVMVTLSTVNGFSDETRTAFAAPNTRYEALVRTIRDVRAVSPQYDSGAYIVFYLEPDTSSPLGWSYMLIDLSRSLFGATSVLTGHQGYAGIVIPLNDERSADFGLPIITADRMVAFRLASDGHATLLETLPDTGDFAPEELRQYNPEAHFRAETTPPPLLRFFLPEPQR